LWGLFAVTLALDARPGAFLVLPFLIIWLGLYFADGVRAKLKMVVVGSAVVGLGLGTGSVLFQTFGDRSSADSNFAYALHAFVHGGKPWTSTIEDHRALYARVQRREIPESTFTRTVNREALAHFRAHPSEALAAYWKGLKTFFSTDAGGAFVFFTAPYEWISTKAPVLSMRWVVLVLAVLGLVRMACSFREPIAGLSLMAGAGIVLSAPFIVGLAGYRVFAATIGFDALLAAAGLSWIAGYDLRAARSRAPLSPMLRHALVAILVFVIALGAVLPLLRSPFVTHAIARTSEVPASTTFLCRPGTESPVLDVVADPNRWGWQPRIRTVNFVSDYGVAYSFPTLARQAPADSSFQLIDGMDLEPDHFGTFFYLVAEDLNFPRDGRLVRFHLQPGWDPKYGWPIRRVLSFDVPSS
jgi:hypothetical protein